MADTTPPTKNEQDDPRLLGKKSGVGQYATDFSKKRNVPEEGVSERDTRYAETLSRDAIEKARASSLESLRGGPKQEKADDPRLLGPKEGIGGKATNFGNRPSDADARAHTEAEDAIHEAQESARASELINQQQGIRKLNQKRFQEMRAKKGVALAKKAAGALSVMGIGAAITAYVWQALFALISLIGFGGQASLDYFKKETLPGKALDTIGMFDLIQKTIPFEMLGLASWFIATLIGIGAFIVFLLYFTLTGVPVFRSGMSIFIAGLCIAFLLFPITNLIPSVVIFVIYIDMIKAKELLT